jgi:polyadenylate-binding protein
MKDPEGKSKGFGFVCFRTGEQAAKAVKKHQQVVEGKQIYVVKAVKKEEWKSQLLRENPKGQVFIRGLSPTSTNDDIE